MSRGERLVIVADYDCDGATACAVMLRGLRLLGDPLFVRTAQGMLPTPQIVFNPSALYIAIGILGATVMPHVIYLHSALTQRRVVGRTDEERKKIFRFELVDVVRIDHFRGFAGYWEIPASEPTAIHGRWMPGPGAKLFEAMTTGFPMRRSSVMPR